MANIQIKDLPEKTGSLDLTDKIPLQDIANVSKHSLFSTFRSTLKTYFDGLYPNETATTIGSLINGATAKNPPIDADVFPIKDSVGGLLNSVTGTVLKAYLKTYNDTLYPTRPGTTIDNELVRFDNTTGQIQRTPTTPPLLDDAGILTIQNATDSTTKDTGCLVLEGGLGVEKALTIGTTAKIITSLTCPLAIGGTTTTSTLSLRSTSGVGTTGADIIFQVGNNGATEAMRILNSGYVGIGLATGLLGSLHISGTVANIYADRYADGGAIIFRRANGTVGTPTQVLANEVISYFLGAGYYSGGSAGFSGSAAGIQFYAAENFTDVARGTYIAFSTITIGATTRTERVRITDAGYVGIGKAPGYLLEVNTDSAGKPGVGGLWTVVSDERIKENIELADLNRCYEIVKEIPLKRFGFKPKYYDDNQIADRNCLGWIANDVQMIFPKAVKKKKFVYKSEKRDPETNEITQEEQSLDDCLDLNSGQILAAMYGAIQKLQQKVEVLELNKSISKLEKTK